VYVVHDRIWPIISGHQEHGEGCLSENTHSTATPIPTQFTSTEIEDFHILSDASKL
jgi:hypothetical protein